MTRRTTQRETRAEAIARANEMQTQLGVTSLALWYLDRGVAPGFEATFEANGATIRARAYGLDRLDGGIVVETWTYAGETSLTYASYVERWLAKEREHARLMLCDPEREDVSRRLRNAQRVAAETRYGVKADTSETPAR